MSTKSPWSPSTWFDNIVEDCQAALIEFVGTTFFLTLAFGGVQAVSAESIGNTNQSVSKIMYIAVSFGLSLLVSAWLFFRVTGGLFNPNVTLALFLTGVIRPLRFVLYCIAQLIGGIAAAALILGLTPGPLQSNIHLTPGVNSAQGVFIEVFITTLLCLTVLMLAAEKHIATPFAPVGIGLTVFVSHLFAINYTGCGMNTARAFGPAVVTGFPFGSQWVYWVGPGIGSILGAAFYSILKHYKYWRLNPNQDTIDHRESPADPIATAALVVKSRSRGSLSIGG
ncbi:aquaporin-like protein [Abortiporus biennis]|nr:aquaporin-like protein [Abortiporus biennis]